MGDEFSIGGDIVYQQKYKGVEIENNFVRICVNKDGVYRLVNKWRPIATSRMAADTELQAKASVADAIQKLIREANAAVKSDDLVYRPDADGTYKLCRRIEFEDGKRYYVDGLTGEAKAEA